MRLSTDKMIYYPETKNSKLAKKIDILNKILTSDKNYRLKLRIDELNSRIEGAKWHLSILDGYKKNMEQKKAFKTFDMIYERELKELKADEIELERLLKEYKKS